MRLPCPWDSPGKNTGVGCHFLLQCMKVKSQSEVTQSCPTLCDPMDCSLLGSSVHGIFQARALALPLPGTKAMPPAVEAQSQPLSHHRSPQLIAILIICKFNSPLSFYIPSSQLLQIGCRQVFWGVAEGIILPTKGKSIIVQ